jgi:hypothetical protein
MVCGFCLRWSVLIVVPGNKIGDHGAIAFATAMFHSTKLTTIWLGSNSIETGGAVALSEALKANKTVRTLDLHGANRFFLLCICIQHPNRLFVDNKISEQGVIALVEALRENRTILAFFIHGMLLIYNVNKPLLIIYRNIRKRSCRSIFDDDHRPSASKQKHRSGEFVDAMASVCRRRDFQRSLVLLFVFQALSLSVYANFKLTALNFFLLSVGTKCAIVTACDTAVIVVAVATSTTTSWRRKVYRLCSGRPRCCLHRGRRFVVPQFRKRRWRATDCATRVCDHGRRARDRRWRRV